MPGGGTHSRSEQLATISRLGHERLISDEVGRLLDALDGEAVNKSYDSYEASLTRVTRRDYEQARKLPPELVAEIARASSTAMVVWRTARQEENFKLFAPYLEKNVALNRRMADALGYDDRPYDALINYYEPGMTTAQLEAIFAELKKAIAPLIASIAQHGDAVDDRVLHRGFDPEAQLKYALDVVQRLGYDLDHGRQDLTAHPFSSSFGRDDVRITTRVSRDFFNECLFGSIHESGHAMYNQGIPEDLDRTSLGDAASPGVHESQSRMWENLVGRSRPFWHHFYPSLRKMFPDALRGVDEEAFFRAVNRSYPSLIRVEADEVTYNMHVLLRFELEAQMLDGSLKVNDLPEAWNELIQTYLGIKVPNDREGALQDIHWSFVSFGVFPGYTLGNLIGAQLMEKVRRDIPDLDEQFERGEFSYLLGWLRKNVHRHGRKFTPDELLERATGKKLTAAPWIAYVQQKFGALYGLEAART
jgi:carboxypeptidase Taq